MSQIVVTNSSPSATIQVNAIKDCNCRPQPAVNADELYTLEELNSMYGGALPQPSALAVNEQRFGASWDNPVDAINEQLYTLEELQSL